MNKQIKKLPVKVMSLAFFAKILGLLLILAGTKCMRLTQQHQMIFYKILRNDTWGQGLFFIACLWFLLKILQLGEADFGQYKIWFFGIFAFSFLGCAFYWKDFLIVRAIAMLTLMSIQIGLNIGYMSSSVVRPYISALFYSFILLAVYFGIYPYRARDILPVFFKKNGRYIKYLGYISLAYGCILIGLSFC